MRVFIRIGLVLLAFLVLQSGLLAQRTDREIADMVALKVRSYSQFGIFDDVNISVGDGTVTLTGAVTMPFKREEIGSRVTKIEGIRRVVNNLRVLPVSQSDANLRVRIAQAIYGHPAFLAYATMAHPSIHIIVEGGRVELTGAVGSQADRSLAYALAQVPGTFAVKNSLKVDK
jgi:hyperosmotically inducible protein